MRIAHFNHFVNFADKPKSIEEQLQRGELIDVTAYAGKFLGARRVFIDSRVHERFVEWSSAAVRRHAVHREAQHRLASLLEASAYAAQVNGGSSFVVRAIDSEGPERVCTRHIFQLRSVECGARPGWLITI
jgi:23S rRNA G2069 N7-methylase RlmK/C1962 C5-methylase RlmI